MWPSDKRLETLGKIILRKSHKVESKSWKTMQILIFSLVSVGLAEIHYFKWVIGCFWLVFSDLDRRRSIVRSTTLGVTLSLFGEFIVAYKKLEIVFIRETRTWIWSYGYSLWIWWSQPLCPVAVDRIALNYWGKQKRNMQFGALTNRKSPSSNRAPSLSSLYYY